ncbi:hypothetical protein MTO96_050569, partial [Rhipicephalus appendiculatus]
VVRNALASAEAALASDGQCTPSTTTEALDGNQAYSGMRSPMTNAEVTELTESSTSDAEAGDSDVSSAFNAADLGTADVDAVQTEESSFPSTHPRSSTPVMDYAPQLDISVASECSDMASDEDDEIIQHADVNEADSTFAVSEASNPEEPVSEDAVSEAKYLVFDSCLMALFERCRSCQTVCRVQKETDGSLLRITATCPLQYVWSWESQPVLNRKAVGNILLAGYVHSLLQEVLDRCSNYSSYKEALEASGIGDSVPSCVSAGHDRPSKDDLIAVHCSRFNQLH